MVDELRLNSLNIAGQAPLKPANGDTQNFYRQQDIFTQFQQTTKKTKEIEKVYIDVTDDNASKRDKQAFDITARPYNMSGFKVMKNSDMFYTLIDINGDDFTIGVNDRGEEVILYDRTKSDGKVRICSVEEDENGNEYYAIKDDHGNIHKFDKNGKCIESEEEDQ